MPPSDLSSYIEANEGRSERAYLDTAGVWTIGVGHTGPEVQKGLVWANAQIEATKARDIFLARHAAAVDLGGEYWNALDTVRQAALTDISFELGGRGLLGFKDTLIDIRGKEWTNAALDLLASRYDHQVPERAERNAYILETGLWPSAAMW